MRAGEGRCGAGCGGMRRGNGESQNRAMLRMGRRLTRHPQLGAVGIPNAACGFACVNLFRISNLDFPCILLVYIRKQKNRCGRPSRKHIDLLGVHRKPYHHGRSAPSVGCFDAPIFPRGSVRSAGSVKALRYAPTASAAPKRRAALTRLPLRSCLLPAIEKM